MILTSLMYIRFEKSQNISAWYRYSALIPPIIYLSTDFIYLIVENILILHHQKLSQMILKMYLQEHPQIPELPEAGLLIF